MPSGSLHWLRVVATGTEEGRGEGAGLLLLLVVVVARSSLGGAPAEDMMMVVVSLFVVVGGLPKVESVPEWRSHERSRNGQ